MDKEQILQEQVKALEKLLELKNEIIKELEQKITSKKEEVSTETKVLKSFEQYLKEYQLERELKILNCIHEYKNFQCTKCGDSMIKYNNPHPFIYDAFHPNFNIRSNVIVNPDGSRTRYI